MLLIMSISVRILRKGKQLISNQPMELVHMDFLSIEPSKGKIENVLVITDHFTSYAQAYP